MLRFVAVSMVMLSLALPAHAQATQGGIPSVTNPAAILPFDPLVTAGRLDNGLRYYIRANQYPLKRAELRLAVGVGSVVEDDDQRGLAHMVEHLAFNVTRHFPKNDLVHYLQSIGTRFGADVNAYTGFDETVFMLTVPTDTGDYVRRGIQILSDFASGVTFDSAAVEGERGVVMEEWRLGLGAGARMSDKQLPVLLRGSRYAARLPIGKPDYLRTFPQSALRRFYADWYRPDLMAVIAVGDFDKATVERQIREQFGSIARPANPRARPAYPVPPHDETYVAIATDPEAANTAFTFYSLLPTRDMSTVGAFRERYVWRLGFDMLNARLSEMLQKPNPPFAAGSASRGYFIGTADALTVFGGVREGGVAAGLEAVMTEAERVVRFGFTSTELDRARTNRMRGTESQFAERERRPSASRADEIVRGFLQGEDVAGTEAEYQLYKAMAPLVTVEEVNGVVRRLFAARNRVLMVSAPEKPGATLPTEAQLLAVLDAVKAKTLEPYRDAVAATSLMVSLPRPGSVTSQRAITEIGATEWKLSNGVTVVLKPTDFVNDQLLLGSYSPGGISLVPDATLTSAILATSVASVGGVGALNAIDLRKVLTGKIASAGASIGSRSESISGSASPRDVETMFQLAYLRFTSPRADSEAFVAFKQGMQAAMANQAANPASAYSDTITATMTRNATRARPMTAARLDSVRIGEAMAVYRDRFADASDFTFALVGNFALDSIKPLVERYLGGLPSTGRKETPKDDGIRPPSGVIEKTVRRGLDPKSQTFIAFTTPFEYSPTNAYVLSSMGEVLTNRLTDKLREALGGTYSVGASAGGSRDVTRLASVTVQFGSAPDRADELAKAVFAELDTLRTKGPTAADVAKVQEAQRRLRETNLRSNSFWMGRLLAAYQFGDDPRDVLKYNAMIDALTPAAIQDAARKYVDVRNYVRVTLLPER